MKVKFLKTAVMVAFAFITGLNVYKSQTEMKLSDAQLKNVEALAAGEYYGSLIQLTDQGWVGYRYIDNNWSGDFFICTDCSTCSPKSVTYVNGSYYCQL